MFEETDDGNAPVGATLAHCNCNQPVRNMDFEPDFSFYFHLLQLAFSVTLYLFC